MEEREAAEYQFRAPVSGDDYQYDAMSSTNGDAIGSQVGWTYVDYMKAAGLDPGERKSVIHQTHYTCCL